MNSIWESYTVVGRRFILRISHIGPSQIMFTFFVFLSFQEIVKAQGNPLGNVDCAQLHQQALQIRQERNAALVSARALAGLGQNAPIREASCEAVPVPATAKACLKFLELADTIFCRLLPYDREFQSRCPPPIPREVIDSNYRAASCEIS